MFSKFSLNVHKLIFESFPATYFVGGSVRNLLMGIKVTDADIATSAKPSEVLEILKQAKISSSETSKNLGVIVAKKGSEKIEITTFRKEFYTKGRFPKVSFTLDTKTDSNRRDFTINAIYLNPITKEVLDFHKGLQDIQKRRLKFINTPTKRIKEDPLRIVRAYRFLLQYNLKLDKETQNALSKYKVLLKNISATRVQREINQLKTKKLQNLLQKVIHNST